MLEERKEGVFHESETRKHCDLLRKEILEHTRGLPQRSRVKAKPEIAPGSAVSLNKVEQL